MKDIAVVRRNEKVRTASRALMQVGSALLSAAVIKLYVADSYGVEALLWMLIAVSLMYASMKVLDLLESEG